MSTSKTGFPPVRLALIIGVVGLLLLGAGVAAFFIDQASRQAPLQISLFPSANYWGENEVTPNSRHLFYRASDTPEAVAAFYQQRMRDHYGSSDQAASAYRQRATIPVQIRIRPSLPINSPACLIGRVSVRHSTPASSSIRAKHTPIPFTMQKGRRSSAMSSSGSVDERPVVILNT